jgi:hypothetical protein
VGIQKTLISGQNHQYFALEEMKVNLPKPSWALQKRHFLVGTHDE